MKKGGEEVTQAIRKVISQHNLDDIIHTTRTRCNGRCKDGCVVIAYPKGTWFKEINETDAQSLVLNHIMNDLPSPKMVYSYDETFCLNEGEKIGVDKREPQKQKKS
ncbi:(2Fe-2S) ferredoxin domain-containing protein [Bacillus solitudinis]|uniref:(2Fe-2S) ferredoxin domain-containing protein n=1 Tax=Bacillus solitudinis TaxID=2014074 RepID=UPI0038732872